MSATHCGLHKDYNYTFPQATPTPHFCAWFTIGDKKTRSWKEALLPVTRGRIKEPVAVLQSKEHSRLSLTARLGTGVFEQVLRLICAQPHDRDGITNLLSFRITVEVFERVRCATLDTRRQAKSSSPALKPIDQL